MVFYLIWHLLCLPLCRLDVWNVLCDVQFSMAYCFLIMVWTFCRVGPQSTAVVVSSAKDMSCCRHCQPPSPPFHPQTRHLYLSTGYVSHTPTNLYAWLFQRGFTAIFVSSYRCLSRARGSAHSCSDWSLSHFHWGGRPWESSLSPDWWMACLTLSEQDGRCVGWGPEIVTPDCSIRAWLIELSSS